MEDLEDEYAIGLDLGTTFSCIGVYRNGWVEIIPNRNGEKITPSVVIISNDQKILVGEETTNFLVKNYDSCIYEVKRLIGRQITEEERKKLEERFPFKIVKSQKGNFPEIKITKDGKTKIYSPVEISSYIIKKMVSNAEKYLNKKITKLVITVPAYFNDSQRKLTRQAAEALGLKVLRIINEPTAAALAYGFDSKQKHNKKILVFDLGGGTFDVSILSLDKNEKDKSTSFEVLGTSGDTNLGGEDFDNILVDIVLNKAKQIPNIDINKIRENKEAMKKLKVACENTKKLLSISNSAHLHINNIIENFDIIQIIDRTEFEIGCIPLFDKLTIPIEKALKMANLTADEIQEVILVGGSTRIPKIKEIVSNYFSKSKINDSINPDEAVAYGATIDAEKMLHNKDEIIQKFTLLDIIPFSLGTNVVNKSTNEEIQKEGDLMDVIIERGKHIPTCNSKTYSNACDNAVSMSIDIYEGEKKYVKYNHLLKKCNIDNLTKRPKGKTKVVMKYDVDMNGILNVEAKEISDNNKGQIVNLTIKNYELCLDDKEMKDLQEKIGKIVIDNEQNIDYLNIKKILKKYKDSYEKCITSNQNNDEENDSSIFISNYYKTLEEFINKLDTNFDNETVLFKFYLYVKDLFQSYVEALKLALDKGDKEHIFTEINKYLEKFIDKSQGYLNELLEILSEMKKKIKNKDKFYILVVFVISKLNEYGKKYLVSGKAFSKYHSLIYFEQAHYYIEKYFPKSSKQKDELNTTSSSNNSNQEEDRKNMDILPYDENINLKRESKLCLEYLQNIHLGVILLCEDFLKKGEIISENIIKHDSGFTNTKNNINIINLQKMDLENKNAFLSNYERLLSIIMTTQENSKTEALCIANIIKINSYIEGNFKSKSLYLFRLARKCQNIIDLHSLQNEKWYNEFQNLYKKLEENMPKEQDYHELLEEMKGKYPKVFKELDNNYIKMPTKDFLKFIVDSHPYKDREKDGDLKFDDNNHELILFLLKKYSPDEYKYSNTNDNLKLQHCLSMEISKKLSNMQY